MNLQTMGVILTVVGGIGLCLGLSCGSAPDGRMKPARRHRLPSATTTFTWR